MAGPGERWILLGRLRRTWGRRGELLVELETDWPEQRFAAGTDLELVWPDGRRRTVTSRGLRLTGAGALLGVEGIEEIGAAEELRGADIVADPARLERLDDGLCQSDLPGLRVETVGGEPVGEVVEVEEGAAADLLRVALDGGGEALVPLAPAICVEVDPAAGRVVIAPPPGLLDLEEAEKG
jgi:16S rRNA processing protein RimM